MPPDDSPHANRLALVDMAQGFFRGKVLCAAVRLGIADALADGQMTADELAVATGTNAAALRRLMRALAGTGVVEEVATSQFRLTALGKPLRRNAPDSVWASMVFWADLLADNWTYLPEIIRAGDRSGAEAARQREGVPSRWSREPDAQAIFHHVFAESGSEENAAYASAWDFSRCRVVADLGGAGGGLLAAVLQAYPLARGMLVDRQGAIDAALRRFSALGMTARCETMVGDLLESVPAGADVYLMRCVLHGYDDGAALRILQNVRRAMERDARLLLMEVVLPDRVDRADPAIEELLMSDLNMLAVTGGCERSESEWRALLGWAGLELRGVVPVSGQSCRMMEAARRE
jgi:hypothetical protein